MTALENFNPVKSEKLIGYSHEFAFLRSLIDKNKLPKVLLFSGEKGIGKATLAYHLMHYIFDKENYIKNDYKLSMQNRFTKIFIQDLSNNIIYLNGSTHKNNIKIENIREIRDKLLKSPLDNKERFIILDDVETFNINSINALLKLIEEPTDNNYFILINNKTKPLLDTLKSRCVEIKIILNEDQRLKIIEELIGVFDQKIIFDKDIIKVSPGNFLKFNYIFSNNKIDFSNKFIKNLNIILNLYKKEKNIFYKDLILYFSEYVLIKQYERLKNRSQNIKNRNFTFKNINNFFLYNQSQQTLLRSIEDIFIND